MKRLHSELTRPACVTGHRRLGKRRSLHIEMLESRQLLAARPIITEFMASNDGVLDDGDNKSSDWIEIHNAGDQTVDLAGYHLTDKRDDLTRWTFPHVSLAAGEYLVVFVSGRDDDNFVDAAGNLHANFSLKAGGEYLAMVDPSGTIVSEFGSSEADYPAQRENVSYGVAQQSTLISPRSDSTYWLPIGGELDAIWSAPEFDSAAHGFLPAKAAIGYDTQANSRTSFLSEIVTTLPPRTTSVYTRIEFPLEDALAISGLRLRLKYDDGFVAHLNGNEIARDNAPDHASWFSVATKSRRDGDALQWTEFDVTEHVGVLRTGSNVLAIQGLNTLQDNDMLLISELIASSSRITKTGYMPTPTPGHPNVAETQVFTGLVEELVISTERGIYDSPFDVTLDSTTPGTEIRYTTDGSEPTIINGLAYNTPIHVRTTTTLRAAAFKDDYLPSHVATSTYVFPGDVINQPPEPTGLPTTWDGLAQAPIPADYEMDPDVVNDPTYRDEIVDGLRSIPTMSLVMDPEDLFGADRGIYVNSGQRGDQWEHPTSVEIIEPDGTTFQADSGIRIHGYSWRFHSNTPKHSFRLEFSREYGPTKLEYKLFKDSPVDRFDSIVLRAQGGRAWAGFQVPHQAQYIRDAFARDTARDMGAVDGHAAFVHLYLNGLYWGLYHAVERPDSQMGEEYFGGRDQDYDALNRRTTTNEAIDGDLIRYNEMIRLAEQGLTSPEAYEEIQRYVDLDDLIDFFLIHQYTTNQDGPETFQSNNQRAIGSRVGDPKFRFFVWDMEYSIWEATHNFNIDVNVPTSASRVYTKLRENPEFRMRYADRAHKNLFNGGALTPEAAAARWETRAEEIYTAIVGESARWGDSKRTRPYTRDVEWQAERNRLLSEYFPVRTEILTKQLRAAQLYPRVDAPSFNQHGGPVPNGFELIISNPEVGSSVLYTLNGTDPRQTGGGISTEAIIHDGTPIAISDTVTVKSRAWRDREWSALNEAEFVVVGADSPFHLRLSEVNFHPHDANPGVGVDELPLEDDQFEYIELTNVGAGPIDLSGVEIAGGINFTFLQGAKLDPGMFAVVAANEEAFRSRYGDAAEVVGEFEGQLSDTGELIELLDDSGRLIQRASYFAADESVQRAAGRGSSLELLDPAERFVGRSDWRISGQFGGSPGSNGLGPDDRIEITEVLPSGSSPWGDMIELHNTTDKAIEIGNWYLSNTPEDYFKWKIPPATTIPPHDFQVLSQAETGLELDGFRGDEIWVVEADAAGRPVRFVEHARFESAPTDIALGPWQEAGGAFLPLDRTTFGLRNSGLKPGQVIISEIHYGPIDPDGKRRQFKPEQFEFIELYNPTDDPVDLEQWQITGDVQFTFPVGSRIDPQDTLLVVPIDPADAIKSSIFQVTLGTPPTAQLAGPFQGELLDEGARLRLEQTDASPPTGSDVIPYYFVDEVDYQVAAPWPDSLADTGSSLQRTTAQNYGNSARSWMASPVTPGAVDFVMRVAGDSSEDGLFNQLDIVQVLQAGQYLSDESATWTEGDWNEDGLFDQRDIVAALQAGEYLSGI